MTTYDHYHVYGIFSDDEGSPALDLREAMSEAIERASMEEDHRASSAHSIAEIGDYESAWKELMLADRYQSLAADWRRIEGYLSLAEDPERLYAEETRLDRGERGEILPPIFGSHRYFLTPEEERKGETLSIPLSIERLARWALGIDPFDNLPAGSSLDPWRDTEEIRIEGCNYSTGYDRDGMQWDDYGTGELSALPPSEEEILHDLGMTESEGE